MSIRLDTVVAFFAKQTSKHYTNLLAAVQGVRLIKHVH